MFCVARRPSCLLSILTMKDMCPHLIESRCSHVSWGCCKKTSRAGGLEQQNLRCPSSGQESRGQKSKFQVWAELHSWRPWGRSFLPLLASGGSRPFLAAGHITSVSALSPHGLFPWVCVSYRILVIEFRAHSDELEWFHPNLTILN